ncbi:MAG: hypothetical protein IT319_07835 [Anaerolineae bacterium]|nr:hypothetical protein [Anaerolineae bacterium]
MNTSAVVDRLVIPVDTEHGGIRLVVILTFIGIWAVSFFIINALIRSEGIGVLAIFLGFPVAYGITALLERFLKKRWPSGRYVEIDRNSIRLKKRGVLQAEVLSEDPATTLLWTFKISKRARVPKGWSMLACAIQHENESLSIYTFMSPAQVESFDMASQFKKLVAPRKGKDNEDMREDLRLAGEQRRLRDAENHRWMFGAEMTPTDFMNYLSRLNTQFSEWMPVN